MVWFDVNKFSLHPDKTCYSISVLLSTLYADDIVLLAPTHRANRNLLF